LVNAGKKKQVKPIKLPGQGGKNSQILLAPACGKLSELNGLHSSIKIISGSIEGEPANLIRAPQTISGFRWDCCSF
jgi:hypothetical protein